MPRPLIGCAVLVLLCSVGLTTLNGQPPGTMPPMSLPTAGGAAMAAQGDPSASGKAPVGGKPTGENGTGTPGSAIGNATEKGLGGAPGADSSREQRDLVPKAFLVLDEAGTPVVVPGLTFEKLDELLRLQEGWRQPTQLYTIESVEVRGRVAESSAELNVTVRVDLEPTGGKWVTVPLRMGNFHRTGPADVSGVERYRTDLAEDGGGYRLHMKSDIRRSVVVTLRAVARVSPPPSSAIEFRLPDAPSRVILDIPSAGVSATVLGRGDEVLQTIAEQNETRVEVDSGGGTMSLRFGTQLPVVDTRPILEAESRIVVDWQQADNSPLVSQDIAVRSGRGDLGRFTLSLVQGVPLLQQPTIRGGAPFEIVEGLEADAGPAGAVSRDVVADAGLASPQRVFLDSSRIGVVPVGDRGDSRVEVGLATQLRSEDGRPGGTVIIRPITVDDAIEQTGEIEIRAPRDYRLRWDPQPWVSSLWDQTETEASSTRVYRFRFDRVPFELPVWLSARAKRLRVEGDYRLTFYDTVVSLRMLLRTSGGVPDSRVLPIEVAGWTVQNALLGGTTTPVQVDQNGDLLEVDLASLPGGGESDRIEITLVRNLGDTSDRVLWDLPRIAGDPELIGTIGSSLSVVAQADYRFIADLGTSVGIGEVLRAYGPVGPPEQPPVGGAGTAATRPLDPANESRYALPDISQPGKLAGFLVTERPRISYQAEAEVGIAGNQLVEVLDWTVYPQGSLRGRLPILWGRGGDGGDAATTGDKSLSTDGEVVYRMPAGNPWTVTVDNTPAVLQANADGEYAVYSELLAGGPHQVRFRRSRELPVAVFRDSQSSVTHRIAGVDLPRPGVADATLRGAMTVRARGDQGVELSFRDPQGRGSDELSMASPPASDLPLRARLVDRSQEEVLVRRAVLRTAISRQTHHDHLIAQVQGGGLFRMPLVAVGDDALVRGSVNGLAVEVMSGDDGTCSIRLGEKGTHTVVVQIWAPRESSLLAESVRPLLGVPTGTERFYWELITPQDDHLVWASPTSGRAMRWQFDRWRLYRQPIQSVSELATWAGASWETRLPPGNRYLFVGVDASGLHAVMMSRMAIWMIVGSAVLLVSCLLTYLPAARHPLLAVVGAVFLSGMTLMLPDASVLAGQVMLVAMLMVAVMAGVGYLLAPRRPSRGIGPGVGTGIGPGIERADRSSVRGGSLSRIGTAAATGQSGNSGQPNRTPAVAGVTTDPQSRGSAAEARP